MKRTNIGTIDVTLAESPAGPLSKMDFSLNVKGLSGAQAFNIESGQLEHGSVIASALRFLVRQYIKSKNEGEAK